MSLDMKIDELSQVSNSLIKSENLGPIKFLDKNGRLLRLPKDTADYKLVLTNRFENYLLAPVIAYGWEFEIVGISMSSALDSMKLDKVLPQFYLNPFQFGFSYPYAQIRKSGLSSSLNLDDICVFDDNSFIILS